jgi:hypothetical protein
MDKYVAWLKKENSPLFEAGGTWWRPYHKALVQATAKPEPVEISDQEAKEVLKRSEALFLRHFTRTFTEPTDFWYVACDAYNFDKLSKKPRSYIRRGYSNCSVQRVDPAWLAVNGYECYVAAFGRYSDAHPISQAEFEKGHMGSVGGPFDFWAVFCEGKLATYSKCVVGDDYAAALVLKSHPAYLRCYPVYALMDTMLKTYVVEGHKFVTFGFRSIAHDTNIQEFLEKFGFQKVYCDLRVVYRPSVRAFVSVVMPFKSVLDRLPLRSSLKSVLTQEEIRRSFL